MSKSKNKPHDFQDLSDYKAAIKLLRRFDPVKYSTKNFNLRDIKSVKDITPHNRAKIRELTRFVRPLAVYGFKAEKITDRAKLETKYRAVYGVTDIPKGLQRFPRPINRDGEVLKTKIESYEYIHQNTGEVFDFEMATAEVSPGIRVARLHFDDIGLDFSALTGTRLADTLHGIWETYEPYAIGILADVHMIRERGMPELYYNVRDLLDKMQTLQRNYGSDKEHHYFAEWMNGLNLYYKDKGALIPQYQREEQARWKKRNALTTKLKNLRRARGDCFKGIERSEKIIRELTRTKKIDKKTRADIMREGNDLIAKKTRKIAKIQKQIDRLAVELYTTD